MMLWITDPHFNFLPQMGTYHFGRYMREENPTATMVLLTGDLAECRNFVELTEEFSKGVGLPTYVVLGNHDAYGGGVLLMQKRASEEFTSPVFYLPHMGPLLVAPDHYLIGVDGWYDARDGQVTPPGVLMSDWECIGEYKMLPQMKHFDGPKTVPGISQMLADREAKKAELILEQVLKAGAKKIWFATHVPPFAGATWHMGQNSNATWLPWMLNQVLGNLLLQFAMEHEGIEITVFCGHTHSPGEYKPTSNLTVRTGHSEYRHPRASGLITP